MLKKKNNLKNKNLLKIFYTNPMYNMFSPEIFYSSFLKKKTSKFFTKNSLLRLYLDDLKGDDKYYYMYDNLEDNSNDTSFKDSEIDDDVFVEEDTDPNTSSESDDFSELSDSTSSDDESFSNTSSSDYTSSEEEDFFRKNIQQNDLGYSDVYDTYTIQDNCESYNFIGNEDEATSEEFIKIYNNKLLTNYNIVEVFLERYDFNDFFDILETISLDIEYVRPSSLIKEVDASEKLISKGKTKLPKVADENLLFNKKLDKLSVDFLNELFVKYYDNCLNNFKTTNFIYEALNYLNIFDKDDIDSTYLDVIYFNKLDYSVDNFVEKSVIFFNITCYKYSKRFDGVSIEHKQALAFWHYTAYKKIKEKAVLCIYTSQVILADNFKMEFYYNFFNSYKDSYSIFYQMNCSESDEEASVLLENFLKDMHFYDSPIEWGTDSYLLYM